MKLQLIFLFLLSVTISNGQTNFYFVNGQSLDSLPKNLNWYSLNSDNSISECKPEIKYVNDNENDRAGKFIHINSESNLIIGCNTKILSKSGLEINDEQKILSPNSKFEMNSSEILFAKLIGEEIYSLFVFYKDTYEEAEIFRNCYQHKNKQYLGCGKIPFIIDFFGDLTNDGEPELLLSADKEGGELKLLIGKENGLYKIIFSHESE